MKYIGKKRVAVLPAIIALVLLLTVLGGCGRREVVSEQTEPVSDTDPAAVVVFAESPAAEAVSPAEATISSAAASEPRRQDGERFEDVIIIEGMEETVHYEHIRNDTIGFEMDYDYELFERNSKTDCECFVSCWDEPGNPENYLEVRYSPLDAETTAAIIAETLSNDYDISRNDSFMLERAGKCIRIDASADIGGMTMPDLLQMVYIVPADDGSRVATAHYAVESAEGFGRRFRCFMDTFSVVDSRESPSSLTGTWQTASMGYADDGTMSPEHYVRFTDSSILYGHLKDGQFVLDHTDQIISLAETAAGGYRIQVEASNGVQYTYQTSESDDNVLEYYETWREEAFPEMYRGGASLGRVS